MSRRGRWGPTAHRRDPGRPTARRLLGPPDEPRWSDLGPAPFDSRERLEPIEWCVAGFFGVRQSRVDLLGFSGAFDKLRGESSNDADDRRRRVRSALGEQGALRREPARGDGVPNPRPVGFSREIHRWIALPSGPLDFGSRGSTRTRLALSDGGKVGRRRSAGGSTSTDPGLRLGCR